MNIAVLIPAYNASATLSALLERTIPFIPVQHIIVVDDGSIDGTRSIAERFGTTTLVHERNKGKGAALQTGFDKILQRQYDAVITMDSDLQHRPESLPHFISVFQLTHPDIIIGSRLHNTKGMPFHRLLSNTVTTKLVQLRTGANISDSQSGYRLIGRPVLEKIRLESTGFEAETELLIKASSAGFRFGSVPIETVYAGEKSSMTHLHTTIQFIKTLLRQY